MRYARELEDARGGAPTTTVELSRPALEHLVSVMGPRPASEEVSKEIYYAARGALDPFVPSEGTWGDGPDGRPEAVACRLSSPPGGES